MASQNREDGIPSGGNQVGRERRDASVCLEISKQQIWLKSVQEMQRGDFPGGPVDGSPRAKAGAQVQSLIREDPTCCNPYSATTEAHTPRACAPQQEKPLQWEASAL